MSSSGKTRIGSTLSENLKIKFINLHHYGVKDFHNEITLSNGEVINNYDSDNAIDWEKLIKDIQKYSDQGVVVSGIGFPLDKIPLHVIHPDIHIHLKVSKVVALQRRQDYITKNKKEFQDDYKRINTDNEKLLMNQIIYPYYLDITKRSKIEKFINTNENQIASVYNLVFDQVIEFINKSIHK
jgi:shikimate kinase